MIQANKAVAAAVLSAICAWAAGGDEQIKLAPRYVDSRGGFSICPPEGCDRTRDLSPLRLVSWRKRDEKTKAIAWTLTVMRASEGKAQVDLNAYAERLKTKLRQKENFEVEAAKVVKLAGREAIDLSGVTLGRLRVWTRQAWVQTAPGKFLIVKLTGPGHMKSQLDAICDEVMPTLQIIEPGVAQSRREANLAKGEALLALMTEEQLSGMVNTKPQWFLFHQGDKYLGFMKVVEYAARWEDLKGLEIKTYVSVKLAGSGSEMLARQVMFTTADRQTERWLRTMWTANGAAQMKPIGREEGLKHKDIITCTVVAGGSVKTRTLQVPQGNMPVYLPRAMNSLMWRVMDLRNTGGCAFAVYNTRANAFDMRTLTVVGPERIELDGKQTDTIRVTDQFAEDAGAEMTWLDKKGFLIRAERGDLVITAAERNDVLEHFPKAEEIVNKMDQ